MSDKKNFVCIVKAKNQPISCIAQYYIFTVLGANVAEKNLVKVTNILRILEIEHNSSEQQHTLQGSIVQIPKVIRVFKTLPDDYFSSEVTSLNVDSFEYSREVRPEEELFKSYEKAIEDYEKAQAQLKAQIGAQKILKEEEKKRLDKKENGLKK